MVPQKFGEHISLELLCTCTRTYKKFSEQIEPYPKQPETLTAFQDLARYLLDPIIDHFGQNNFRLTYGFCSPSLKRYLEKKDPSTGKRYGCIDPSRDQHMAHELNRDGKLFCNRLGAACDFQIVDVPSHEVVDWILVRQLPFDSLYYYGPSRPIHLSYGPQHKRDVWTFTATGQPTRKGIEAWVNLISFIP